MEQSPFGKANTHSASQEIPRLYGIQRLTTELTWVRHWYLSCPRRIHSTAFHFISL